MTSSDHRQFRVTTWQRQVRRAAVALVVMLMFASVGAAAASNASAAQSKNESMDLPYELSIQGANGMGSIFVRPPDGSKLVGFSGSIQSTYSYPGVVSITVSGRRVARVDAQEGGSVSFKLSNKDLQSGVLEIGMAVSLRSNELCFDDSTATATLKDSKIEYTIATSTPETIAEFFSEGMDSYQVLVPATPTKAEQAGALTATAALTHRYAAPTRVDLLATSAAPASNQLNRVVVIAEDSSATQNSLSIDDKGRLHLTGTEDQLQSGAVALGDPNTALIQGTSATGISAITDNRVLDGETSLSDFGLAPVHLSGVGEIRASWSITQSGFGQAVDEIRLRLRGGLTQLPEGGQGRVDFYWNDDLVGSRELSRGTGLDLPITLGTEQIKRDNTLDISLKYVPPGGKCYPIGLGAEVTIDVEQSTITGTAGQGLPQGFDRFPQVFQPQIPVAFGPADEPGPAVEQAGKLLAGLQSIGAQQLTAHVVSVDEFSSGSRPGIITGADDSLISSLSAPLGGSDATVVQPNNPEFSAKLSQPYATLQGFANGDRDLVLLGQRGAGSSAKAVDQLASYADSEPLRWRNLLGLAYVHFDSGAPTQVTLDIPEPLSTFQWQLIVGVIMLVVLVGVLLLWLWRKPKGTPPPAPNAGT